jgi:3-oxoacyl-[acyl-carrier protein] reductase
MVRAFEEDLGTVDILVNNAGIAASHRGETTEEEFDRTIAVNLMSAFLTTETALPGMRERHWHNCPPVRDGREQALAASLRCRKGRDGRTDLVHALIDDL